MNTADFHSIALLEATREHIEQAGALLAQTQLIVDTMSCGQWKGGCRTRSPQCHQ